MRAIHLMAVEPPESVKITTDRLPSLSGRLARVFGVSCSIEPAPMNPSFSFDALRGQYYSTLILARMAGSWSGSEGLLLAITSRDLYVPILTYVFGEAQLRGPCAIVSTHRLTEEFYGLAPDEQRLEDRLVKESLHELGHTQGLRHCADYECVMASSHSIEYLDLKQPWFCGECRHAYAGFSR